MILPVCFYERPVVQVARELLGKHLVRVLDGQRLSGVIYETEAYRGEEDLACHARAGRTPRTAVMYGPPGCSYVYFTYGIHWLLNCVCEVEGVAAAVLVRAVWPIEGLDLIGARRNGRPAKDWCSGPARLTQAFGIGGNQNNIDLTTSHAGLWIEEAPPAPQDQIVTTARIGINSVPEPWRSIPWRFVWKNTFYITGV